MTFSLFMLIITLEYKVSSAFDNDIVRLGDRN